MPTGPRCFHTVVAEPCDAAAVTRLREVGTVSVLDDCGPDCLLPALAEADAVLIRSKAHVTAKAINAAPRLKVIARASPTLDHIDLRAAQRRGIQVVYSPHLAVSATAEFSLAMLLALHRRILFYDYHLREGQFDNLRTPTARDLARHVLGFLGMDPVAEKLARMCSAAFGMPMIVHEPAGLMPAQASSPTNGPSAGSTAALQLQSLPLDDLLARADVLSVHLPHCPATRGFLNAERLGRMKPTALLLNTSRGAVIDTAALAAALKKQRLGGAALDVFELEPLPADHPIRSAPNTILTPHVAGMTLDAAAERFAVVDDIIRVLRGEPPLHPAPLQGE